MKTNNQLLTTTDTFEISNICKHSEKKIGNDKHD